MSSKNSDKKSWWKQIKHFLRTHVSLSVIVLAALLVEVTTGIMYYAAQVIVNKTLAIIVTDEMDVIALSIQMQMEKVEVTLDNLSWVLSDDLAEPDSLLKATYQLVENNPIVVGSSISCIPNLYPEKGYWYEPYSVRRANGTIESMQLGSAAHDYTKREFFTEPIARGTGYWSEPYMDREGAKTILTSYGVPVHDAKGQIVAVVDADLSLDWLEGVVNKDMAYKNSQRFLVTAKDHILVGEDSLLGKTLIEKKKEFGDIGYFTLEVDGQLKHAFYNKVGDTSGWVIFCVVDDNEVFGGLRKARFLLLSMILAGFLLLGFIVWRTNRNLRRLRKMDEEKQRISSELRVASNIQQHMLPHNHMTLDEVEIDGSLVPAREVGGDLFDYFVRDEKLFFCIGDVSGKGVPSAIFMAVVQSQFRMASTRENNPACIMKLINESACRGNKTNMFVTMFIGVLDLPTGHLHCCNAGHDKPYILAKDQWSMLDAKPNMPVGLFDDATYCVYESRLEPDSTLFLYTDGLTEAMNAERKQFSPKRIEAQLSRCVGKLPKELIETVSGAVHEFVGDAEQSDDLTMLAIRYTPRQFNSIPNDCSKK